jgi:hypothetical protein
MNYSVKTLAARWGCSQEIVDNLINAGQLGAFPIGPRTIRIPEEHERRLLEAFRQYQHRDDWMILDADGRQKLRRRILSMGGAIVGGKA